MLDGGVFAFLGRRALLLHTNTIQLNTTNPSPCVIPFLLHAQYVLRHQAALTGLIAADLINMAQKRTLSHFDTNIMVKIFGYRDLAHYYTRSSLRAEIVCTRTLVPSVNCNHTTCSHACTP